MVQLFCAASWIGCHSGRETIFAYVQRFDEDEGKYLGLRAGEHASVIMDSDSLLVKPDVARRQLDEEKATRGEVGETPSPGEPTEDGESPEESPSTTATEAKARRFHGTVSLDPLRVGRDADQIADAVIQHLTSCLGAEIEITIEIHAEIPTGVPDDVVRTVTENVRTLRFDTSSGFERE